MVTQVLFFKWLDRDNKQILLLLLLLSAAADDDDAAAATAVCELLVLQMTCR